MSGQRWDFGLPGTKRSLSAYRKELYLEGQAKKMGMPGGSDATRTSHHYIKRLSAYQKELLIRDGNICHKHTPVKDFGPSETSDNAIADHYLILKYSNMEIVLFL